MKKFYYHIVFLSDNKTEYVINDTDKYGIIVVSNGTTIRVNNVRIPQGVTDLTSDTMQDMTTYTIRLEPPDTAVIFIKKMA
jgi:outer membrane receptor for ferric coprogen and ferric-rhodotorulic acid